MNQGTGIKFDIFKDKTTVTRRELESYFRSLDPEATDDSIRKRISRYKQSGILVSVKRGVYAVSNRPVYRHPDDSFANKLGKLFIKQYSEIDYCVWSSAWLYSFTVHQPAQYFYLFETERDMLESSFNFFKDHGTNVWLDPDEDAMQLYVAGKRNAVVVKPLVKRAPLAKNGPAVYPSLEKMIADAYIDDHLFYFLQGNELQNMYRFAFDKYSINYTKLINYAKRRGREDDIIGFVKKNVTVDYLYDK